MIERNCGYEGKRRKRESPPDLILIVTEGEKTEPNYFKRFRIHPNIYEVKGVGRNTVSLVEEAKRFAEEKKEKIARELNISIEAVTMEVWCVFDRDSFTADQFNSAIQIAENYGFKVAFSNEAFELWYLLHFHFYNTGITRDQYIIKLTDCLKKKYEKNSEEMYDLLRLKQKDAIRNAKRLEEYSSAESSPAKKNPCTTVYKLVEYLNQITAGQ